MRNDADYGLIMTGRQSAFTNDFNLAPLFSEETNKPTQNKLFHLITLILPDPEPNFCIVDSNYDVKFDAITYTRFPVKFSGAELNSDGSISKASITVANVSREIMYYIEKYNGLRNCRVLIKTVYENVLDEVYFPQADGTTIAEPNTAYNNTAFIEDEYLIDTYTATEQAVVFQLDPIIDLEIRLPRRRYMTDSCYFLYKDPDTCKVDIDTGHVITITSDGKFTIDYAASIFIYGYSVPFTLGTEIGVNNSTSIGKISKVTPTYENNILVSCAYEVTPKPDESLSGNLYVLTCGKTLSECRARFNQRNFGGFPGVSASRRLFI